VEHFLKPDLLGELQAFEEVPSRRRGEMLAATLLGVFLDQFGARCGKAYLLSNSERDGKKSLLELATRTTGGQRPANSIDHQRLLEIVSEDSPGRFHVEQSSQLIPYLACTQEIPMVGRLLFLLEGIPGSSFDAGSDSALEQMVNQVENEIQDALLISTQAQLIEEMESRIEEFENLVVENEIEVPEAVATEQEEGVDASPTLSFGSMHSSHEVMIDLFSQARRLRQSNLAVLICGETGTGKSQLAKAMHEGTEREKFPFEVVSCGALTPTLVEGELFGWRKGAFSGADEDQVGVFERANGGVILLEEVGDLPMEIQQKLLRVLQEGVVRPIGGSELVPIDVRTVASTCQDLSELVREGKFREDLYYRLAGFVMDVPPLRERAVDLPQLIASYLQEASAADATTKKFSDSAMKELLCHPWPGNLQQLKNVVFQAVLTGEGRIIPRKTIENCLQETLSERLQGERVQSTQEDLVLRIPATEGFNDIIAEVERLVLLTALRRNRGNKSRVTKQLKIPRQTLYNKLERYGIDEDEYK